MQKIKLFVLSFALGCQATHAPSNNAPAKVKPTQQAVNFHGTLIRDFDPAMPNVDALAYDLVMSVDTTLGAEGYSSTLTGSYAVTQADPLTSLDLDFANGAGGNAISDVQVALAGGAFAEATYTATSASSINIALPSPVSYGNTFQTRIMYTGLATQEPTAGNWDYTTFGFLANPSNSEGRRIIYTANQPYYARTWMPLRDHPRDGAMFAMQATVANAFYVAGNGALESSIDNGDGTTTWQYTLLSPTPTYDFDFAAYDNWTEAAIDDDSVDMRQFTYASDAQNSAALYASTAAAMDYLQSLVGATVWPEMRFVETPSADSENTGAINLTDGLMHSNYGMQMAGIYESLANQWAGSNVRVGDYNDAWVQEGMAQYLMWRAMENIYPAYQSEFWKESILADAIWLEAQPASSGWSHVLRRPDPEIDGMAAFDLDTYNVGAMTFRMLEHWLGRPAFDTFLNAWFTNNRFAAVTTADLQTALQDMFPGYDFDRFFHDWVYSYGYHPEITIDVSGTSVTLTQVQTNGPFGGYQFPIDLQFTDASGDVQTQTYTVSGNPTTVTAPFAPVSVVGDPDEYLFATYTCDATHPCKDGYFCDSSGIFTSTEVSGAPISVCQAVTMQCAFDGSWQTTTSTGDVWSFANTPTAYPYSPLYESMSESVNGTAQATGTWVSLEGIVTVTNAAAASGATVDACVGDGGVYRAEFSTDCSSFTLYPLYTGDACSERQTALNGATFTQVMAPAAPAARYMAPKSNHFPATR